jgi:ribosomal protein S27AE
MRIEHILVGLIAVLAILSLVRAANRSEEDKAKPSWAVRAINAAGGDVEATRLLPATGELIGRGTVAAAGKAGDVGRAKVAQIKDKRADAREARTEARQAREERAAEIADKATAAALQRGRAVVEAVARRWEDRKPARPRLLSWGRRDEADEAPEKATDEADKAQPQHKLVWDGDKWSRVPVDEADAPVGTSPPQPSDGWDGGDPPLLGKTDCPRCGAGVKTVIPASDQERTAVCRCGFRITFYRAPNDPPDEEAPGTPITDSAARLAIRKAAAHMAGYCTADKCLGNGVYVELLDPEGVRRTPCPNCTDKENNMTAPTDTTTIPMPEAAAATPQVPMPIDWRATAGRVAEFNPESDADLINFMSMEIAGMCGYSEAYEALFETCTRSLGLDPRSVAGLGEFGERVVELTKEMALAHKRFVVIYEEVMRMVADGTVMPHNGRFFSGDVAV